MVMESATLSNPQRKFNVAPVQKSLSLPSYARAGGEGIDHRLIFAALEQKEKVRRKSKIFTREKTARQNIFCLPISTGSKCRETSLSSDTSCSSLEYQKPKLAIKPKKEDSKPKLKPTENDPPPCENSTAKTNFSSHELKTDKEKQSETKPHSNHNSLIRNITNGFSLKLNEHSKGYRSPVDTLRLNVGSSDSMERSSRSSNDSLSRKERLVAIKARVEAEREKYGISSSDEEFKSGLTRYNSDGGIHRTVREVKSRSYRNEKRLRRRSQGEWAIRKIDRKNNLSLCLNPEDDSIKLHLEKLNHLNDEINHLEVKTDFCPSPNVLEGTKKNYFSDFPSRENVTKFVQQRIRHIEETERKRRSGSDFFDKIKTPPSCSSLYQQKTASIEHLNQSEKKMTLNNCVSDIRCSSSELSMRASPIQRVAQAPTPPPRSPKSITFVNKAFLQHQNAALSCQENGADKKNFFHPNISAVTQTRSSDKCVTKKEVIARHSEKSAQLESSPAERQRLRELFNSRRKTCGNFDFIDEKVLNDLCSSLSTVSSSNLATSSNYSCSLTQIKNIDNKSYPSSAEVSPLTAKSDRSKSSLSKWEENERKREFMFNSLESKKNSNSQSWAELKIPLEKSQACFCNSSPDNKKICDCKYRELVKKGTYANSSNSKLNQFGEIRNSALIETTMREKWGKSSSSLINEVSENKCTFSSKLSDKKNVSSNVLNSSQNNPPFSKVFNQCENRITAIDCNNSLNSQSKDNSVTANLDSAMAELENVYLSLKLSSDNLSDRNSLSNISLSDEEANIFNKVHNNLPSFKNSHYKRSSIHEINSPFNCMNDLNFEKSDSKNLLTSNHKNSSNPLDMNYGDENSKKDTLFKDPSFNELFSDLMPQWNSLEEKLKSHDYQYAQTNNCPQVVKSHHEPRYSPSSIRLKKEFYENLHLEQNNLQKKKVAIQKLTKNLSNLMNSPDSITVPQNLSRNNTQTTNLSVNNSQLGCPRATILNSYRTESKPEPPGVLSRLGSRTDDTSKPVTPKLEEIRHIRVSMDCTSTQKPLDSLPETSKYPRLSSAVHSPLASPKCDGNKTFQFTSRSNSKENVDKAIDGLEELLNSLLVDVNESKQSSLSKTKVSTSTTTTISTGEMCVMQHLDVIRLKPVPS